MRMVNVNDFNQNPIEFLQWVNEHNDTLEICDRGLLIATVVPPKKLTPEETETTVEWLENWKALGEKISANWPEGVSAAQAVKEQRREL